MNGTDDLQGPSRAPGPPVTVLVLLESDRNRSLIRGWLESSPAYAVVTADVGRAMRMNDGKGVDSDSGADVKSNADGKAETETTGATTETLPDTFDICLLDTASLERFTAELRMYKQRAKPAYLPYVLLRSSGGAARASTEGGPATETGAGAGAETATATGTRTETGTTAEPEPTPTPTPAEGDRSTQSRDRSGQPPLVDEILTLPADWDTLQYRLENLQKTRRLSIELADRADQYRRLLSLLPDAVVLLEGTEIST